MTIVNGLERVMRSPSARALSHPQPLTILPLCTKPHNALQTDIQILPQPYHYVNPAAHPYFSHFTADRAMREMNRKEKEIIKAYLKAVKYASQLESRVRIMLIGDGGSGR